MQSQFIVQFTTYVTLHPSRRSLRDKTGYYWNTRAICLNLNSRWPWDDFKITSFVRRTRAVRVVLFSVQSVCDSCLFVCLSVSQHNNSWTIRHTVTKFSGNHHMVEKADKFENGYIEMCKRWFNVSDVLLVLVLRVVWWRTCPVSGSPSISGVASSGQVNFSSCSNSASFSLRWRWNSFSIALVVDSIFICDALRLRSVACTRCSTSSRSLIGNGAV